VTAEAFAGQRRAEKDQEKQSEIDLILWLWKKIKLKPSILL
jgi:hypothetical protein